MRKLNPAKVCDMPPAKLKKAMMDWGVKYSQDMRTNRARCRRTYKAWTEKKWYKGAEKDLTLKGLHNIAKRYKLAVKRSRKDQMQVLITAGKERRAVMRRKKAIARKRKYE